MIRKILLLALAMNLFENSLSQSTVASNAYLAGRFLGWTNTNGASPLEIRTNNITRMYINGATTGFGVNTSGFIGVGTAIPAAPIHIVGFELANNQTWKRGLTLGNNCILQWDGGGVPGFFMGGAPFLTDIAITPSGNLYGIDFYNFYSLYPSNGSETLMSIIDSIGSGFNSLLALNNNYLMGIRNTSELFLIDVNSGNTTLIDTLGYSPGGDLTYFKGKYYFSDQLNQLIRFEFNNLLYSVTDIEVIGVMNTPNNSVYGVFTFGSNCVADSLKIVACEGNLLYEVNPENVHCTLLCNPITTSTITGATSPSETLNHVEDTKFSFPNVFSPNNDGINDYFLPIGAYSITDFSLRVLNRWGQEVNSIFTGSNLQWDGRTKDGTLCSEGVYFYIIEYTKVCYKKRIEKCFCSDS